MSDNPDLRPASDAEAPEILPLGADGLLIRFARALDDAANRAVLNLAAHLDHDMPEGVREISTTLTSVYVQFDPDVTARAPLVERLAEIAGERDWSKAADEAQKRRWTIPVCFGGAHGPQLKETAEMVGMSEEAAVADLIAHPVRVLAIGFAPGQPYLGLLPDRWDIPRLKEITPSIPAGALVVAVRQLIVFSNDTPTGWRQIGQSAFRPFNRGSTEPFPLSPGDVLTFSQVSAEEFDRISRANSDGLGGARLEALE